MDKGFYIAISISVVCGIIYAFLKSGEETPAEKTSYLETRIDELESRIEELELFAKNGF